MTSVWTAGKLNDWFRINDGMRQGCVMSPWLSNACMDGVMKGIKVRDGWEW